VLKQGQFFSIYGKNSLRRTPMFWQLAFEKQILAWMANDLNAFLSSEIGAPHAAIDDPGGWKSRAIFAPPAPVFAVLYLLAFVWFLWTTVKIRDQVYFILTFFCSSKAFFVRFLDGQKKNHLYNYLFQYESHLSPYVPSLRIMKTRNPLSWLHKIS